MIKPDFRISSRQRLDSRVKVILSAGPGIDATIDDVSTGGIAVLHSETLPKESQCHVYFLLPLGQGQTLIQARCRVAGNRPVEEGYRIGLQFVEFVSDEVAAQQAIAQYLEESGTSRI